MNLKRMSDSEESHYISHAGQAVDGDIVVLTIPGDSRKSFGTVVDVLEDENVLSVEFETKIPYKPDWATSESKQMRVEIDDIDSTYCFNNLRFVRNVGR